MPMTNHYHQFLEYLAAFQLFRLIVNLPFREVFLINVFDLQQFFSLVATVHN